jgi:hypothetical protein
MGSRFYVERNLFSYLSNTMMPMEESYFDDEFVDSACYTAKAMSYIILGVCTIFHIKNAYYKY